MDRNDARKAAEVMLAYADGKEIEFSNKGEEIWSNIVSPAFDWRDTCYRIKPKPSCRPYRRCVGLSLRRIKPGPKYRPFKNAEECWQEMQKHQPFGWVKSDDAGLVLIARLEETEYVENDFLIHFSDGNDCAKGMFQDFFFADGTPFGIKEEENEE